MGDMPMVPALIGNEVLAREACRFCGMNSGCEFRIVKLLGVAARHAESFLL